MDDMQDGPMAVTVSPSSGRDPAFVDNYRDKTVSPDNSTG
jgi:hypothetical protein